MKWFLSSSLVLNVILLTIILFMRECKTPCESSVVTNTDTIMKVVTIKGETKIIRPKPDTVIDSVAYPVYIDTNKTIKDYFAEKRYTIPIRNDSVAKLTAYASVTRNSLDTLTLDQEIHQIIKTVTVKEPKRNKLYMGIAPGLCLKDSTVVLSGVVALNTKKDHLYFLKAEPFKRQLEVGLLWKLKANK